MLKLIQNEWIKYFNRPGTYIMLIMIMLLFVLLTVLNMSFGSGINHTKEYSKDHWKTEVQTDIKKMSQDLERLHAQDDKDFKQQDYSKMYSLEQEIPRLQYYLKHDVRPPAINNVFDNLLGTTNMINFVIIMVTVITSSLMSREHQQGTIKLLLIRPASRLKIFFAKWLTAVLISVAFTLFTFIISGLVGIVTGKINPTTKHAVLDTAKGKYHMEDFWLYFTQLLLNDLIYVIIFATIAYVLSVLFKNTAVSLGLTIGLLFFSGLITNFIADKTDLVKFIWPANWSMNQYIGFMGAPPIDSMSYSFSFVYNIIALALLLGIGLWVFTKRDVAD
ncbi:ABC transporter permease [Macrococcus equipercicus]|uniref:ABC transporter permease subunit n=1 Tax=Macrococcus equipercicus TaxID=69967 RepID=A0A9Q9F163_9STAP|nr:ABC transporter permease subunit [Macrococcus equipercicus]UTH13046.1 ABC transporter permease subunit [Macrococcus equipercicus]